MRACGAVPRGLVRALSTSSVGERSGTRSQKQPNTRKFVHELDFVEYDDVPIFQVMDEEGNIINAEYDPAFVGREESLKMHETMVRVDVMDKILYEAQRQGRISFYMTSGGEEATHVGSASALEPQDVVFAQYRD